MVPKHSFLTRALEFIRHHELIRPGDAVLVGVSGGPDSVALLHVLKALRGDIGIHRMTVAHFEHGLRGTESLEDRAFVEKLAGDMGLDCRCGAEDVTGVAKEMHVSWEMAARFCRHRFFRSIETAHGGAWRIALAHTSNDQAEEVLMRLCRGSGPSGLGGMRPREDSGIVRPLLFAARAEVLDYLDGQGIAYRKDSSNEAPCCQRNRIRLEVLPLLQEIFHRGVEDCIERHAQLVRDEEEYWNVILTALWPKVCEAESEAEVRLLGGKLRELHPALLRRVLRHAVGRLKGHLMGIYAHHIEQLCEMVRGRPSAGPVHLPSLLRARMRDGFLSLTLGENAPEPNLLPMEPLRIEGPGEWPWGDLIIRVGIEDRETLQLPGGLPRNGPQHAWLDAERIQWPLCLRGWHPGDRFQPVGFSGHKKLQDFFVDRKVPRGSRERIPILGDQDKICWVVGYRLDDRVKVTPHTRRLLFIEVLKAGPME